MKRTIKKTHNIKLGEKFYAGRDGLEISLCSENRVSKKFVQLEIVSGRDHTTTIIMDAGKGGVRKEEIQQWGTITLMRTVKKTHNIKLREKC
mgnify:CR=1 FL=1